MSKSEKISQHQLFLVKPKIWAKLRKVNKVSPNFRTRAKKINCISRLSQPLGYLQHQLYDPQIRQIRFEGHPPVFVIGHWRSGTTHLHYLLAQDPQFGYLSNYQAFVFNLALLSKSKVKNLTRGLFPETRPQDNIRISPEAPAEEEQPLCTFSECSGLHSFFFPRNQTYLRKYNLFEGISPAEKAQWERDYHYLLQSIAYFNQNPRLLLKNPHNTGRVRELLNLYPNAKFIFIHRNPYEVFQSTLHLFNKLVKTQFLQDITQDELASMIIENFLLTLQKYLRDRNELDKDQIYEIAFSDLEYKPIELLAEAYTQLGLGEFDQVQKYVLDYLKTVKNYKKNNFSELSDCMIDQINTKWQFFFEAYQYKRMYSFQSSY